jgi:hypothetical protein
MKTMDNPPQTTLISLTIDGSCARIELAREDKFNALNVELITELIEVFDWTKSEVLGTMMHWKTRTGIRISEPWFSLAEGSISVLERTST